MSSVSHSQSRVLKNNADSTSYGRKRKSETTRIGRKKRGKRVHRISSTGPIVSLESEKFTMKKVINKHLFRVMKFIDNAKALEDTEKGSVCQFLAHHLKIPIDDNLENWWSPGRQKMVNNLVREMRSNASNAVQVAYLGKSLAFILFCYLVWLLTSG